MKAIIIWLISFIVILVLLIVGYAFGWLYIPITLILAFKTVVSAGFGGALYLIRAVYVNKCVKKQWDTEWEIWYYLRPIASLLSGIASYIFLQAGILVLSAEMDITNSSYGFMAIGFIAGLNVDKFVAKLEEIAKATWGIEKTRANEKNNSEKSNDN